MRLLASGRASEISDLGAGRVLRRFRDGGDPAREGLVMEHARARGLPVPRVLEVRGDALVFERVAGPTMYAHLRLRPWRLAAHALRLATLHKQLHAITAPPTLPPVGEGEALLHLDFHPLNVVLSRRGPVVLDWTNARRGDSWVDVAMTCLICATSGGGAGRAFAAAYARAFDGERIAAALTAAAELRVADPRVANAERAAVDAFVAGG